MSYLVFRDQRILMNYFRQSMGIETSATFKEGTQDAITALTYAMHLAGREREEYAAGVAEAGIELIFNVVGLLHALGLDPQPLWDEMHRANVDLIKHPCIECDGKGSILATDPMRQAEQKPCPKCRGQRYVYEARRTEAGTIVTPTGWRAADLPPLVHAMLNVPEPQ